MDLTTEQDGQGAPGAPSTAAAWIDALPAVSSEGRRGAIVPSAANEPLEDAETMVSIAMARAEQISDELDDVRETARRDGLEQGRRAAQAELAETVHALGQEHHRHRRAVEALVADLAIDVAKRVMREAPSGELARRVAATVVAERLDSKPYAIHLHEDARAWAEAALADVAAAHPGAALPTIVVDIRLAPGRAVLATERGLIDLDLETQFEALRAGLTRAGAPPGAPS